MNKKDSIWGLILWLVFIREFFTTNLENHNGEGMETYLAFENKYDDGLKNYTVTVNLCLLCLDQELWT